MTPAPISVERLRELIAEYWDLAYAEGAESRSHDTPAGDAMRVSAEIDKCIAVLLHQLAELERDNATMRGTDYHQVGVEQEQEIIDLEAKLAEREAEVERLKREVELRKHAVDRWVPCPDHRDKTDGRCYVCASDAAERAREGAIDRIITGLSEYGESVCQYEFGLPDYDEHIEAMRNIVRSALAASGGSRHG